MLIPGQQLYQDDLRDQWRSYAHRDEWLQVARLLFDFVKKYDCCISLVSGEIHLGAYGYLSHRDRSIPQFISPGIVHPPPPAKLVKVLDWLAPDEEKVGEFTMGMKKDNDGKCYVAANGFLKGYFDGERLSLAHHWVGRGSELVPRN